jgi:DNA (cytosine-5)-methyltransferase 1
VTLVLSLFPGIGLLDRAFEEEGFCIVRGPDVLWGGDVRRFHPPAGVFAGVIGGPPCQSFSSLNALNRAQGRPPRHGNLIPEFERVAAEAQPVWWLMENVPQAPLPTVAGYVVQSLVLDNRWVGGEQQRRRRFSFGSRDGRRLHPDVVVFEPLERYGAVTSSDGGKAVRMARYTVPEAARLQGLPEDFLSEAPFTVAGKLQVIANGVPLPMGRAIARAVKRKED